MKKSEQIIRGVIYNTMGETGPEVKYYYPRSDFFDIVKLNLIAIKSITLLTGEEGRIPDLLSIITFTKYQLVGIVFHFEVPSPEKRGGFVDSNLTVLISEIYSSIAYKYSEQFKPLLEAISKKIIENEIAGNWKKIKILVQELYENLIKNLASLREAEEKALKRLPEKKAEFKLKIVVIGDANVGKTTMLLRYVDNSFQETYLPTIGVNVCNKKISILGKNTMLNFFDIAGQEKFELIRRVFYEGINGALIVFDLTKKESFNHIENWSTDVSSAFLPNKPKGIIIGNKLDLKEQRVIDKSEAEAIAKKLGLGYMEVSAKTGENINETFAQLAKIILKVEK